MKKILLSIVLISIVNLVIAQHKISGKITDENRQPLAGVSVFLPELNKGTVSDKDGNYLLSGLPESYLKIRFSYMGYATRIENVKISGENTELNVVLTETAIEAPEIVVSGGYQASQHENAIKIELLKLNELQSLKSSDFMEIVSKVPGVDMISKGPGVSKPVIRGLSMDNILVLNNGVRFENYQYSSHHPLGIEEYGIEDVEIIKGPSSLLYGSDAIGGVINFIREKPAPVGYISGDYHLQLFSNTMGMTNNFGIKGSSEKLFAGIRIGQKTNADFLQGGGLFVPNSRFNEKTIRMNAGFTGKSGVCKIFYDYSNHKLGLVEEEAVSEIINRGRKNEIFYQEFNTRLLSSQNNLYLGKYKLDVNAAFQNTELIHFAEKDEYEIQMKLSTLTYEAKLFFPSDEKSKYIIGFQGLNQKNTNLNNRETILLPDAFISSFSFFGLIQKSIFNNLSVQSGIRYDVKNMTSQSVGIPNDTMVFREALDKTFSSLNGSVGVVYTLSHHFLIRANISSAYRTPNLAELTSKGEHELRFEIGDNSLKPEKAVESDISFHYHLENLTFDLAGFYNSVNNFIFITPTGDTTASGISIYRYKQANSFIYGGETGLHFHPNSFRWLHFETTFSYLVGKQKNGDFLPFIPANQLNMELSIEKEEIFFLEKVFASVSAHIAFEQNHPANDESATSGYSLFDLATGGTFRVGNQEVIWNAGVSNLLDTPYISHLSILKETDFLDPGRNIYFSIKLPFNFLKSSQKRQ